MVNDGTIMARAIPEMAAEKTAEGYPAIYRCELLWLYIEADARGCSVGHILKENGLRMVL